MSTSMNKTNQNISVIVANSKKVMNTALSYAGGERLPSWDAHLQLLLTTLAPSTPVIPLVEAFSIQGKELHLGVVSYGISEKFTGEISLLDLPAKLMFDKPLLRVSYKGIETAVSSFEHLQRIPEFPMTMEDLETFHSEYLNDIVHLDATSVQEMVVTFEDKDPKVRSRRQIATVYALCVATYVQIQAKLKQYTMALESITSRLMCSGIGVGDEIIQLCKIVGTKDKSITAALAELFVKTQAYSKARAKYLTEQNNQAAELKAKGRAQITQAESQQAAAAAADILASLTDLF